MFDLKLNRLCFTLNKIGEVFQDRNELIVYKELYELKDISREEYVRVLRNYLGLKRC